MLTYLAHALWAIGNPFLGTPLGIVATPGEHIYFFLLYGAIFTYGILRQTGTTSEVLPTISSAILNSVVCYGLFMLFTFAQPEWSWPISHAIASAVFLLGSASFWLRRQSKVSTFFYAMTGYFALTVAIISKFGLQPSLVWLSWQSLLVVSTAIWYRSKYIVLANFVIYLTILAAYLFGGQEMSIIGLSVGVVALLSARIMNAQQHRLELKTEAMRNAYLGAAFIFFPIALYRLVPREYVALSWVGVALLYYLLNVLLKKQKYRWMAVFTLLITVIYVLIVGIISMEPEYRIISFVVLGVVLLVISMVYTRLRAKKGTAGSG